MIDWEHQSSTWDEMATPTFAGPWVSRVRNPARGNGYTSITYGIKPERFFSMIDWEPQPSTWDEMATLTFAASRVSRVRIPARGNGYT